jgi:uncharacterized membrane protein
MSQESMESGRNLFKRRLDDLSARENRVLQHIADGVQISRNTNVEFEQTLTLGQRLADRIAAFGGSWPFILLFLTVLAAWIALNSVILPHAGQAFDPYPYILLNLFLSMLAAIQAPIILMSQNRQVAKDRLDAAHDYEVNLKAELEIRALHEKLDTLREGQWEQLLALQRQQAALLEKILERLPDSQG